MIGAKLSHYTILEPLGAGGMGVVYLARDDRLERQVAIKVLPTGALADESARKQFRKEALALSKLNHPNIATIHDFDSQDGTDFLVMELVEGRTLSERIAEGRLPEADVRRLGSQLALGLEAAHRRGVLHRDIKPGNLRVTPDGHLKILDFGLAKMSRTLGDLTTTQTVTATGTVGGTVPYMSPEQLRGEPPDARSDIYSVGAVLYEMACGKRAFPQEDAARMIAAILGETPAPPSTIASDLSGALEGIVARCLLKNPVGRYETAGELAEDLLQLETPERPRRPSARSRAGAPRWTRAVGLSVSAIVAAAAVVVGLNIGGVRDRLFPVGRSERASLAVLPFTNESGDPGQEYFVDGMTDELITRLAGISTLKVISRSSSMQYKGARKPLSLIGHELGVTMLVEGAVHRAEDRVKIRAQLTEAAGNRSLWADSLEAGSGEVSSIQSELPRGIADRIRLRLTTQDRARLAQTRAVSSEAHDAYLRGRYALDRLSGEQLGTAVEYFTQAVRLEPGYAQAWAGLAIAYRVLSGIYVDPAEAIPKARAAANRAIEADPNLAEAHTALAEVAGFLERDWKTAERELDRAIQLDPNSAPTHGARAGYLLTRGRLAEAQAEVERARELDPLMNGNFAAWILYLRGHYDEAISRLKDMARMAPSDAQTWYNLGQCYVQKRQYSQAIEYLRKAVELADAPWPLGMLGYAYAVAGHRDDALAALGRLHVAARTQRIAPTIFAYVYAGLGEHDQCFKWLEEAYVTRDDNLNNLNVEFQYQSIRSDPRYADLIRRLGLDS